MLRLLMVCYKRILMKLTIETKAAKGGGFIAEVIMEGMSNVPMKTKVKEKPTEGEAMPAALQLVKHIYL